MLSPCDRRYQQVRKSREDIVLVVLFSCFRDMIAGTIIILTSPIYVDVACAERFITIVTLFSLALFILA